MTGLEKTKKSIKDTIEMLKNASKTFTPDGIDYGKGYIDGSNHAILLLEKDIQMIEFRIENENK